MNAKLHIRMRRGAAALERLLGVIRFRGFEVARMNLHADGTSHFEVSLEVQGHRRIIEHLEKLQDVEGIVCVDFREASGSYPDGDLLGGVRLREEEVA